MPATSTSASPDPRDATPGIFGAALCLCLAGCYSGLGLEDSGDGPGASAGADDPAGTGSGDDGGGTDGVDPEAVPGIGPSPVRRLTHREYENTLRDLLPVEVDLAQVLPSEDSDEGFSNEASRMLVTPLLADNYLQIAEDISAQIDLEALVPCDVQTGDRACVEAFVEDLGPRAYRRPLDAADVEGLLAVYDAVAADADFATAARAVLQSMLISPYFLYRVERGIDEEADQAGKVPLTSYEMASRLSYFFWSTMPDDELFELAASDGLRTPQAVEEQARRLLADPRSRAAVVRFYVEWLHLSNVEGLDKDADAFPQFDAELAQSMADEIPAFIDFVVFESDATLRTFLTSPVVFVDSRLAEVYGVDGSFSDTLEPVEVDPTQRAGILTRAALLASQASAEHSDPIRRGLLVREQLLCDTLPDPPPDVMPTVPEVDPNVPARERYEQHSSDPACSACHQLMDPIGFGFEAYDAIGSLRTMEGTLPIDSSGELVGTDIDGPFDGVPELADKLSHSEQVQRCVIDNWLRYTLGRQSVMADEATLEGLQSEFAASDGDLHELLIAMTQTDAFLHRQLPQD